MAIKPKSRAHEDRIKALEEEAARWRITARLLIEDNEHHRRRIIDLECRRWWQFWK